jgi:hypothetical protein
MFIQFGTPKRLGSIGQEALDVANAKVQVEIAVLDDNPFAPKEALCNHKFRITELGPDIRSLDQIANYPIIICDVGGVGLAFGSRLEGAHLVAEIRKAYPDKFLIAYTGLTYSLAMTNALAAADKRLEKDASIEAWVQTLEIGVNEVMNPRKRWIRMRRELLDRGVDLFDVFKFEQAFIKSMTAQKPEVLSSAAASSAVGQEAKDLVVKFAATALSELIAKSIGA